MKILSVVLVLVGLPLLLGGLLLVTVAPAYGACAVLYASFAFWAAHRLWHRQGAFPTQS